MGATATLLVDRLEEAGVRCDVYTYAGSERSFANPLIPRKMEVIVRLKAAEEPLAADSIAAWTACAGSFRVYFFRWLLAHPWRVTSGLGGNCRIGDSWVIRDDPGAIIVPRVTSKEDAEEWLRQELEKW